MAAPRCAGGDGDLVVTIRIDQVSKWFAGDSAALDAVDLTIEDGEFVVLLGPSGSGKTTLLRVIAGLEAADSGRVFFDDVDVTDRPAQHRGIGFVFQQYALFRHMTVAQNIAFGLKVMRPRRLDRHAIAARVDELLALVRLPEMAARYPSQLSGGQRQRVALARALARDPQILLLDEPFGALDPEVRVELRQALREIHDRVGLTTVFVTHDRDEAFILADRIAILGDGRVAQFDEPATIDRHPANAFVKAFVSGR